MADINLTQAEADALVAMEKHRSTEDQNLFPMGGQSLVLPLQSLDKREQFVLDLDPTPLLDNALSPDVQRIYQANTEEAIQRSVFGSPTYFVDGDMFSGQDHLEMVERALQRPYAGIWPKT